MQIYVYLHASNRAERTRVDEEIASLLAQNNPDMILFWANAPGEYVRCRTGQQTWCTHLHCGYIPRSELYPRGVS